ncbi:uncharacterized protein EDB91DRAFT_1081208 [Suillus paluster]|uniref:uncharacterized protein n=1 Tax=Suillus paluster TaxID=48578 RepID=UPI001B85D2E5|nr:uncharacterized protein EDB91DRAFT_1081208 [Suillus paluster]KAG1743269.1 hypothetical protein EDB91DRAFT_1081208 [Suillus paluster]
MDEMEKKNRRGISQGAWWKENLPLPDGMTEPHSIFVKFGLVYDLWRRAEGIHGMDMTNTMWKIFAKDSSVTRHLSQPRTSCHSSIWDIVNNLQFTEVELPSCHTSLQADAGVPTTDMYNSDDQEHANFNGDFNFIKDGFGAAEGSLEEQYKSARMCYSKDGLTFLDLFNADKFAECRKASKEEWEIGDFLLCSPLSMAAIDVFLKLPLVSTGLCTLHH